MQEKKPAPTMRVRFLIPALVLVESFDAGVVADIDDNVARRLIANKHAVASFDNPGIPARDELAAAEPAADQAPETRVVPVPERKATKRK
jgi:hypothetical protein